MKKIICVLLLLCGTFTLQAQIDSEVLRKAIGYYQQLKFEESIVLFDQLVTDNPEDKSIKGRRGFVIAEYVKAMDEGLVTKLASAEYLAIVKRGIEDLESSLAFFPKNTANTESLTYLKSRL